MLLLIYTASGSESGPMYPYLRRHHWLISFRLKPSLFSLATVNFLLLLHLAVDAKGKHHYLVQKSSVAKLSSLGKIKALVFKYKFFHFQNVSLAVPTCQDSWTPNLTYKNEPFGLLRVNVACQEKEADSQVTLLEKLILEFSIWLLQLPSLPQWSVSSLGQIKKEWWTGAGSAPSVTRRRKNLKTKWVLPLHVWANGLWNNVQL